MLLKHKVDLTVGTDAYTAADVVGGLITLGIGGTDARPVTVKHIVITDEAAQAEKYHVYFFNADPSATCDTDDDAFAPVAADADKMLWVEYIADSDYITVTGVQSTACVSPNVTLETTTNLYAVLVAVETPDYAAATDVNVTFYLEV